MSFVSYSRTIDWILNCNKNKNTKPTSLKTIFIFKSQFTVAAIIINHELKILFTWTPPRSCQSTFQSLTMDYWIMFPVKCRVQGSISFWHLISLSVCDGFPVCVEQMIWTRRHSNTQGEKSVLTVDDFFSDAGYTLTKKLSLHVFMCSYAALYWQWGPATVIFFLHF